MSKFSAAAEWTFNDPSEICDYIYNSVVSDWLSDSKFYETAKCPEGKRLEIPRYSLLSTFFLGDSNTLELHNVHWSIGI